MKRLTLSWVNLVVIVLAAFILGWLVGPNLPHYKLVRVDDAKASAQVPKGTQTHQAESGWEVVSETPDPESRRAPPCKNGAPRCEPWERTWTNDNALHPGEHVTPEGAIYSSDPNH